jgi:hypothetical protein
LFSKSKLNPRNFLLKLGFNYFRNLPALDKDL